MVCDRQKPEQKPVNLDDVRKKIQNDLYSERISLAARRYSRDLRRASFIDVRL